jgi:RimJ/RimL family protein N-acetyltransferase
MLFKTPIETDRLLLRPETEADCDDIYRMNIDPDVMRFVGDGSILSLSRDEFLVWLRRSLAERASDAYGLAAVVLKETNKYIGACWLKYDVFLEGVELGYRYMKNAWGKGYASEAGKAVLTAGFELPQLEKVFARAHPQNFGSIRVIEKLGFKLIGHKYDPKQKVKVRVYSIQRTDFVKEK